MHTNIIIRLLFTVTYEVSTFAAHKYENINTNYYSNELLMQPVFRFMFCLWYTLLCSHSKKNCALHVSIFHHVR